MPIQIPDSYSDSWFAKRQTGLLFNLPAPDADVPQLPEGVSLCMIVKNEERFLAECLESVKDVVDEICIVDTGSTDRTVEIARSYGAKLEFREWRNDFSWARNESLKMATKRWTLVLDADEELDRESAALMRSLRTTPAGLTCVYINIVNFIEDSAGSGTMSHRLVRLFPTNPQLRYTNVIHECLTKDGGDLATVLAPIRIIHKGYTGEILAAKEKDTRNRPLVDRAYAENEDDAFSLFNFGNAAICGGDPDTGCEVLERMLAEAKSVRMYFPLAYLMLGQTYAEHYRDNEKGLAILDKGAETFPQDAGILFARGQVLTKMDRTEEARESYHKALGLREQMMFTVMTDEEIFQWKIFYSMAGAYEKDGDYDSAIEWMDRAIANKPNSSNLRRAKAKLLEGSERFYDAEVTYRELAELDPRNGRVELVNFLLRRKRFAQAIALVESAAAPESASNAQTVAMLNVAAARAMIEAKMGDPGPFLEAALRYAPGNGLALAMWEEVLTERGDTSGLARMHAAELDAPLVLPPDFARRSYRLLALGRDADSLDAAQRGLQIEPGNAELRFNAALGALRLGNEHVAAEDFGRVDDQSAAIFSQAMQMRAALLLKAGDADKAVAALERWLAAAPDDADAVLTSAQVLLAGGAREKARSLLEAHAAVDQRIALELAGIYLQDGDVAGAGRIAERALT